jgi:hypothetical protein
MALFINRNDLPPPEPSDAGRRVEIGEKVIIDACLNPDKPPPPGFEKLHAEVLRMLAEGKGIDLPPD